MSRRVWAVALTIFLTLSVLAGCVSQTAPSPNTPEPTALQSKPSESSSATDSGAKSSDTIYPITLKDSAGRSVVIPEQPKRIISVAPANTELVFALGQGASLVGRSDYCDFPAEAAAIESIGDFFPPNYEKIISLKPDLMLLASGSDEARDRLVSEFKMNVFVVDPQNFAELYDTIQTLGILLNAQDAAQQVVAHMQESVKGVTDKVADTTARPKLFYEVWHNPLMTAGSGTFIDELITLAGGINAGAEVDGWTNISLERLAAADPDIIVSGAFGAPAMTERSGWQQFTAIKSGNVHNVTDPNIVVRAGPRLVLGLQWFARLIHPDIFK